MYTYGDWWEDVGKAAAAVGAAVGAFKGSKQGAVPTTTVPTQPVLGAGGGLSTFLAQNQTVILLAGAGLVAFMVLGSRRGYGRR